MRDGLLEFTPVMLLLKGERVEPSPSIAFECNARQFRHPLRVVRPVVVAGDLMDGLDKVVRLLRTFPREIR